MHEAIKLQHYKIVDSVHKSYHNNSVIELR